MTIPRIYAEAHRQFKLQNRRDANMANPSDQEKIRRIVNGITRDLAWRSSR